MIAAFKNRIPLSPGYHAEPGETRGHLHDVYTTREPLGGNRRIHVGTLTKDAVEAWRDEAEKHDRAVGAMTV